MEPKAAEVVPKSIIKEAIVAPTVPKATSEMIAKSREKLQQGAYQESLKIIQTPPIEQRKISDKLEQFGIGRDADGKKKLEPDEQLRHKAAEDGANLAKKFIENGYDKMSSTPRGEQEKLRDMFLAAAKLRPYLAQEMQGPPFMNLDQLKAFAERYLKDPRYSKELRTVFDNLLDPDRKFVDISPSQEAKEKADLDLEDAKAEKTDHSRVWKANDRQLKEYEVRPAAKRGGLPQEGAKYQRLQGLTNEIQIARNDLTTARGDLTGAQTETKKFRDDLSVAQRYAASGLALPAGMRSASAIKTDFDTATLRETSARERVSQLDGELKTKEGEAALINEEHQGLIDRRKELDAERRTLERKFKDAEREATKRQWTLQDTKTVRVGEETDLANGFRDIFSETSNNILNTETENANNAFAAELEAFKQKTTDNNERAMYDALQNDMLGPERTRKKGVIGFRTEEKYRPISKAKVNAYHATLMTNGPEETMKSLLLSRINPATGVNYTDPEVASILTNKEYVMKMQPEVVKQILARKMLTGGISTEDIHVIVNSQWGKDMLGKAKETNDAFRTAIETDMGKGALSSPNFGEKLGEQIKKHPWWLALILGIPFLVGGAAAGKTLEDIGK